METYHPGMLTWIAAFSLLCILLMERAVVHTACAPLSRLRRLLIPLPVILLLAANLDGVLSLKAWVEMENIKNRAVIPARYSGNEAWDTVRFALAGLIGAAILPFLVTRGFRKKFAVLPAVWTLQFLWFIFVLFPLMLMTGLPLRD